MIKQKSTHLIILLTVLIAVLGVTLNIQRVNAPYPIIFIRADGSIYPQPANITSSDNITYTFTADINASIIVEKDDIIIDGAGYTLQGPGNMSAYGIDLSDRTNVTIQNTNIKNFRIGIYLISASSNVIYGNSIENIGWGIHLTTSSNNTISGNNITNNGWGIDFAPSSNNNTVYGNNITENNQCGIFLYDSSDNEFYHNNIIDNTQQVNFKGIYANYWDDGVEGNYWSNYTGLDSDHDGIGDTVHNITKDNIDHYPLMGMFSSFNTSLGYYVNAISNSTIEDFQYFESNSTIIMYVSNMTANQTHGFCRICIPHTLMNVTNISVVINDGLTSVLYFNDTIYDNGTHRSIYFAYEHSTHKIVIIPEFPTWASISLILILLTVAVAITKRKTFKTQIR